MQISTAISTVASLCSLILALGATACGDDDASPPDSDGNAGASSNSSSNGGAPSGTAGNSNGFIDQGGSTSAGSPNTAGTAASTTPPPADWPGPRVSRRIDAYRDGACVIIESGAAACWGAGSHPGRDKQYVMLSGDTSTSRMCGVTVEGELSCSYALDQFDVPAGPHSQVSIGTNVGCVVSPSGDASCWEEGNDDDVSVRMPPAGPFEYVAAGAASACGMTAAGALKCWGSPGLESGGNRLVPSESYAYVDVDTAVCGLKDGGTIGCWYGVSRDIVAPGSGYVQLALRSVFHCALHMSGSVTCWGREAVSPPAGVVFEEITAGGRDFACGITTDRDVVCWGNVDSPDGIKAIALDAL